MPPRAPDGPPAWAESRPGPGSDVTVILEISRYQVESESLYARARLYLAAAAALPSSEPSPSGPHRDPGRWFHHGARRGVGRGLSINQKSQQG
jgi:hypothetical protein